MKNVNVNVTEALSAHTQELIDAYTAELRRKLDEKLSFINTVTPVLDKYQKTGMAFTVWKLGCDVYGDAYKVDRGYSINIGKSQERARDLADSYTHKLTFFVNELVEMGILKVVTDEYAAPSSSNFYRFVD